jgi:hypothetical protein
MVCSERAIHLKHGDRLVRHVSSDVQGSTECGLYHAAERFGNRIGFSLTLVYNAERSRNSPR